MSATVYTLRPGATTLAPKEQLREIASGIRRRVQSQNGGTGAVTASRLDGSPAITFPIAAPNRAFGRVAGTSTITVYRGHIYGVVIAGDAAHEARLERIATAVRSTWRWR